MRQVELITRLFNEGRSIEAISRELKVDKKKVSAVVKAPKGSYKNKSTFVTDEEREQMVSLYKSGKKITEIMGITGRSYESVARYLGDIRKVSGRATRKTTIDKIKEFYHKGGLSSNEVAKKLGISKTTVLKYLENTRQPSSYRQYVCDSHYFDVIDTPAKAYWLGIMFTDGNVSKHTNAVSLNSTDKGMLEAFIKVLNSDYPIYTNERSKKNPKWKDTYALRIYDEHLKNTLIKKGVVPNKTKNLSYPKWLSSELNSHFIRGLFDGDGSVWSSSGRGYFSITGYLPFLEEVQEVLIQEAGVNKTKLAPRKESSGDIRYGGKVPMKQLYDYLYKDARYFLRRKKEKFEEFLD